MKSLYGILLLTGLVFLTACARKPDLEELLKNNSMRHDIMTAICNDHNMALEMVNDLTSSSASIEMMKGNCDLMKTVMTSDIMKKDTAMQNLMISKLVSLINDDSVLCDKTCGQITQNPKIEKILHRKMHVE
jgi:hypothetical protein